jgi:excisionase family DNA binding protein
MDPLVFSIAEACERAHIGHTSIYQAINAGELRAVKRGRRTLILHDDLVRYVQSLPPLIVKQSGTTPPEGSTTDRKDVNKSSTRKDGGLA